jgi:hypothetical protein
LWARLSSHASGRRSGDQLCVYVADRFVLPVLTRERIEQVGAGELSLDAVGRDLIREELSFRFVDTRDGCAALELERRIQARAMGIGKPLLNPI